MYTAFLPPDVPTLARAGITEALHLARHGGEHGWLDAARDAYDQSYRIVLPVIAGALALGTVVIARLLHGPAGGREGAGLRVK